MNKNGNKGRKPQTIYNIGTANLEIDYQKLAEAIVKANREAEQQTKEIEQDEIPPKQSFLKLVWEIWINKRIRRVNLQPPHFLLSQICFSKRWQL